MSQRLVVVTWSVVPQLLLILNQGHYFLKRRISCSDWTRGGRVKTNLYTMGPFTDTPIN